ncbi:MAG: glycoside hydrolase family 78 protein [Clostridiales bacterium]|nr:glycoside hydrolase family 78 protein [Clostridiales bacterium]
MRITDLKLNGITNPVGFSCESLVCSWKVRDTEAKKQKNVVIEIADSPDFSCILEKKAGSDLLSEGTEVSMEVKPYTTYYWRVRVTADNEETAESEAAFFETGKIGEPWMAQWISANPKDTFHPVFEKEFCAGSKIAGARMYISGVGLFEAYINGKKVGDEYLTPYLNDYVEAYQYLTFDITDMLKGADGDVRQNRVEIMLGKGWYMSVYGLDLTSCVFGDQMKAIAEIHIRYEDGSTEVIGTDDSWSVRGSDVAESGIYFGEIFDRTLWSGKENTSYPAQITEAPGKLTDRYSLPVVVKETLHPVEIIHTPAGETVLDFGQNYAGFMEFDADFAAGTRVKFECAEVLQEGNFYHANYRDAESEFVYVSDGRNERVRPHFTYFGYRYLKVTGWPGEITKEDVWSNVMYSDLERIGYLETSDAKINRLYQNTLWSMKSNFIDLPTDCPQRSERLGWTGDAQIFAPTASWHMDTRAFYRKFLRDLRTEQVRADGAVPNYIPTKGTSMAGFASVWGDVSTFIPEAMYKFYGATADCREYYPLMKDWVEFMRRFDVNTGDTKLLKFPFQFGDWVALDGIGEMSYKGSTDDDFIGSVYYYRSSEIVADMAQRLGKMEDANFYRRLSVEIRTAILNEYFSPSGRLTVDNQAAYVIALKFGIYIDKEKLITQFKTRLKNDCYKIRCGFVGAPILCMTLCENGMSDLAYKFLFQEDFPSWLYEVNLGATTVWERWNSVMPDGIISKNEMNSLNHYSYGSVVEFFYTFIAGISSQAPGFRKARIAPIPTSKFRFVNCSYDSICGKYVSNWKIADDGAFSMEVEVPFGCEAEIVLPDCDGKDVVMNGDLGEDGSISGAGSITVPAGRYTFSYRPLKDYRRVYDETTTLAEVAEDEEVLEILKEDLPQIYGTILDNNMERMVASFADLYQMGFMGFTPEQVDRATKRIYAIRR